MLAEIDLQLTLMDSAQCFHWVRTARGYGAVLDGRAVWLRPGEEIGDARMCAYLDLERDYAAVARAYAPYAAARAAFAAFPGLRVVRQPPWEALFSFILSANNNVGRIRGLVAALSRAYGKEVDGLYALPEPAALARASQEDLRALGVGYRAPYLLQTARRVQEGFDLEALGSMPYERAHALLCTLPGVGDKVADCVLLFGCGHAEAFPVDVWVERLMRAWFGVSGSRRRVAACARERFGANAGILQQFLFHAARVGAISI